MSEPHIVSEPSWATENLPAHDPELDINSESTGALARLAYDAYRRRQQLDAEIHQLELFYNNCIRGIDRLNRL